MFLFAYRVRHKIKDRLRYTDYNFQNWYHFGLKQMFFHFSSNIFHHLSNFSYGSYTIIIYAILTCHSRSLWVSFYHAMCTINGTLKWIFLCIKREKERKWKYQKLCVSEKLNLSAFSSVAFPRKFVPSKFSYIDNRNFKAWKTEMKTDKNIKNTGSCLFWQLPVKTFILR